MGLIKRLFGGGDFGDVYAEAKQAALTSLGSDPSAAFNAFRGQIEYGCTFQGTEHFVDAMKVFAQISDGLAPDGPGDEARDVAQRPDDPKALFDLGYAMFEAELHSAAAVVLERANELVPGTETIVTELSSAFEAMMRWDLAIDVLEQSSVADVGWCRYLLGFNQIMCGRVDAAKESLAAIGPADDESLEFAKGNLTAMLDRAAALPLDSHALREWHMVLNSSLLLHRSPHGLDDPMRGRYAFVQDRLTIVREGIERLANALEAAGRDVPAVFWLPERGSEIIAKAAAKHLGVPARPYPAGGTDDPGLIAAYDLTKVPAPELLAVAQWHKPGQVLWSHAECWTDPFPYAPDVCTFLYQFNTAPWKPALTKDGRGEADDRSADAIADAILVAPPDEERLDDQQGVVDIIEAMKPLPAAHTAGILKSEGRRLHNRTGSPVPSNRFN